MEYLVVIEKAENNYGAYSPDVLGCIATAKTVEETLALMKEALEFHLEDLEEFPEAKGLKYHLANRLEAELAESDLRTRIKVELPELHEVKN
ncbi:MAG: type II toxin-antitoxin system HicB family antitoxin [Segetibacter sp.]|nr:type II toxin-antitoxin system HicB family antitoxin [Segetibacter sp.]